MLSCHAHLLSVGADYGLQILQSLLQRRPRTSLYLLCWTGRSSRSVMALTSVFMNFSCGGDAGNRTRVQRRACRSSDYERSWFTSGNVLGDLFKDRPSLTFDVITITQARRLLWDLPGILLSGFRSTPSITLRPEREQRNWTWRERCRWRLMRGCFFDEVAIIPGSLSILYLRCRNLSSPEGDRDPTRPEGGSF